MSSDQKKRVVLKMLDAKIEGCQSLMAVSDKIPNSLNTKMTLPNRFSQTF